MRKYEEFREGQECKNCGGKGRVWEAYGEDDGEYVMCESCDGEGRVFSSEYERDKYNGRL